MRTLAVEPYTTATVDTLHLALGKDGSANHWSYGTNVESGAMVSTGLQDNGLTNIINSIPNYWSRSSDNIFFVCASTWRGTCQLISPMGDIYLYKADKAIGLGSLYLRQPQVGIIHTIELLKL